MAKHIFSTLAADNRYTNWRNDAGLNTPEHSVLIKGGAGVALIGNGQLVDTPRGARTEVSDADAAFLQSHPQFMDHVKRGFIVIANKPKDPDVAAEDMEKDAGSAPKTPADVKASQRKTADDDVQPVQAVVGNGKK